MDMWITYCYEYPALLLLDNLFNNFVLTPGNKEEKKNTTHAGRNN